MTDSTTPSTVNQGEAEILREALAMIASGPGAGMGYIKGIGEFPIGEAENMARIAREAIAAVSHLTAQGGEG